VDFSVFLYVITFTVALFHDLDIYICALAFSVDFVVTDPLQMLEGNVHIWKLIYSLVL